MEICHSDWELYVYFSWLFTGQPRSKIWLSETKRQSSRTKGNRLCRPLNRLLPCIVHGAWATSITFCLLPRLQVGEQQQENERLWAAINRSSQQEAGRDGNRNHHSVPSNGGGERRLTNHGGRSAGASAWNPNSWEFLVKSAKPYGYLLLHMWYASHSVPTSFCGLKRRLGSARISGPENQQDTTGPVISCSVVRRALVVSASSLRP